MASYNVNYSKHATLVSSTVDTIKFENPASFLMVVNRGATTDPIFFTYGNYNIPINTPAVFGDESYVALPGMSVIIPVDGMETIVKVISASAQTYSVQVV